MENLLSFWQDREKLRIFVNHHPILGALIFIFLQALQVVVAPIPGEATGFVAGFLFGTVKGFFLSLVGIIFGSTVAFFLARFFKKNFLVKYEKHSYYLKLKKVFKKHGATGVFLLYLFPGFPKDLLNYLLGLLPMPFKIFLSLCILGRIPGTLALAMQGDIIFEGKPYKIFILSLVFLLVFFLFIIFRKKFYQNLEQV